MNQESRAPAEDGMMRCDCDLEAKFGVASKEGPNKGRKFWYVCIDARKTIEGLADASGLAPIAKERSAGSSNGPTTMMMEAGAVPVPARAMEAEHPLLAVGAEAAEVQTSAVPRPAVSLLYSDW
jgi:hypothetical protein